MTLIRSDDTTLVERRRNLITSPQEFPPRGSVVRTEGVSWGGAVWTKFDVSVLQHGTRQSVPLASLTSGAPYTYTVEVGNPTGSEITIYINWANSTSSVVFSLAPGARRVVRASGARAYDAIFRFGDVGSGPGQSFLARSGTVEKGITTGEPFDGSTPASGDKSYTWAGTPNASESIEWESVPVVNISPLVVEGFEYSRPARSILHPLLGSADHDVTFRPGGLRAGRMRLVMPDAATARAAEVGLLTPRVFTLTDSDVSELTMRFVVAGEDIGVQLDPVTRRRWIVTFPFQEVL